MSKTGPDNKKSVSETVSLEEAQNRLQELGNQNRELKQELESLRAEKKKSSTKKSFFSEDDRRQTDINLSPDKGLLRCIIDTVGDLIYVKDRDGIYRGCNKESERFVGLTEAEQIGKSDFDFFPRELAEAILATDKQVLASGLEHCAEEWVPSPEGKIVLLETKKAPFYGQDGKAAGIVGISRDVTSRKLAEDALKNAYQELDAFARTVAHDLRTPLTPIIGYAELLREKYQDQLDPRAVEYLEEIISLGEEMLALMKDLLALATSGKFQRPKDPVKTGEVVKDLIRSLDRQLTQADLSVKLTNLPSIRVPKTLLFQVFENLILNALNYGSQPGDVIEVGGERNGERVNLYVRDHGPGIPTEERESIFELFTRGTTVGDKPGTGIGLATVQKIAKRLDGHAWVEETPGGGSTFKIDISDPSESSLLK